MSIKKRNIIPLHIVDDHNDALYYILRGLGSKILNFTNNLFIHFDAHPDLLLHEELKKDDVYDKEVLLNKVSIETWILPLAFGQNVNEIVWIKPEWSNQIDDGVYTFYIGETKDNNIKVSEPLMYFVSALTYAPFEELIDPKKITLHVITWDSSEEKVKTSRVQMLELIQRHDDNYLLDIDLDFFYTLNPFLEFYSEAKMFEQLRCIYSFSDKELVQASAKEAQKKRKNFLHEMEKIFTALEKRKNDNVPILDELDDLLNNIKDEYISGKVKHLIKSVYEVYCNDIDWLLIHTAGTTIDDNVREIPNHPSTDHEINTYIKYLEVFLKGLTNPKMVTMARSSYDNYCPSSVADQLQERVQKVLVDSFTLNVTVYDHVEELNQC